MYDVNLLCITCSGVYDTIAGMHSIWTHSDGRIACERMIRHVLLPLHFLHTLSHLHPRRPPHIIGSRKLADSSYPEGPKSRSASGLRVEGPPKPNYHTTRQNTQGVYGQQTSARYHATHLSASFARVKSPAQPFAKINPFL